MTDTIIKKSIALLLLACGAITTKAQTSNVGELTVLPNTQFSVVDDFTNTPTGSIMNDGDLYAYANWTNNGTVDFMGDTGLTRFVGTATQLLAGTETSFFNNVLFSNNSSAVPFQLQGSISVDNEAEFDAGVVDNDNFGGRFVFERSATHSNTSDDSHVDGPVDKNGDTGFGFPIGDNGFYRMAGISAPDAATDMFRAKYFHENSNGSYPHANKQPTVELIDNTEYWTVERTAGNSEVLVTLSWDSRTTPAEIFAAPTSSIHIVRWDAGQQLWVDEGGVVDEANQSVTTMAEVSGYGVFTLARATDDSTTLPGGLIIYNALTPNNNGQNDFFHIAGIDGFPNNSVRIFNRWGNKVFETRGYNESNNVFRGASEADLTITQDRLLPAGTYFYVLEYEYQEGVPAHRTAGYLYINQD